MTRLLRAARRRCCGNDSVTSGDSETSSAGRALKVGLLLLLLLLDSRPPPTLRDCPTAAFCRRRLMPHPSLRPSPFAISTSGIWRMPDARHRCRQQLTWRSWRATLHLATSSSLAQQTLLVLPLTCTQRAVYKSPVPTVRKNRPTVSLLHRAHCRIAHF